MKRELSASFLFCIGLFFGGCLGLGESYAQHAWFLPNAEKDRAFVSSPEGITYLKEYNFDTVVTWASWYQPRNESARPEKPWGRELYRIHPEYQDVYKSITDRLRKADIHVIAYVHPWNITHAPEEYKLRDVLRFCKRMREDYGLSGLYMDGPYWGNEVITLMYWKAIGKVFGLDNRFIAHDSLTAKTVYWHGRWIHLAHWVLVGEDDPTIVTDLDLDYHLTPTRDGPKFGFILKMPKGTSRPEQREMWCRLAKKGITTRAMWGWMKTLFDESYVPCLAKEN